MDEEKPEGEGRRPLLQRRWLPQWRPRNVARLFNRAVSSFRPVTDINHHAATRLRRAERRGLQLAILCRTVGFAIATLFYVFSLTLSGSKPTLGGMVLLGLLAAIGVAHFIIIGTRYDRPWMKFVTAALDIGAICFLLAVIPLAGRDGGEIPQVLVYRGFGVFLLFPFIALAALSLSPRLVLWSGLFAIIAWWATFVAVTSGLENPLSWSDLATNPSREVYELIVLSPEFTGRGTRMVETLCLFITAIILSLAVARARAIFIAQVHAEEARESERRARARITQQLGRFVPASIARRLIDDPSGLRPQVRPGAALVMDIRDFTSFAAERDPAEVISELNTFLADCADFVAASEGVVITFTGDGLLATFNTPIDIAEPERAALNTARALAACGKWAGFNVRVGVAAGPIAAGSIGSSERQAFTVYGDTVNRAARLEALGKELGEQILVDGAVRRAVKDEMDDQGSHVVRGFSVPIAVWSVKVGDPGPAPPKPAGAAPQEPIPAK